MILGNVVSSSKSWLAKAMAPRTLNASTTTWQADSALLGKIDEAIDDVATQIAPVWPLADYVAVNPWAGMADRPFGKVQKELRSYANIDLLMPIRYYRQAWNDGHFNFRDLQNAIDQWPQVEPEQTSVRWELDEVIAILEARKTPDTPLHPESPANPESVDGPKRGLADSDCVDAPIVEPISHWMDARKNTTWSAKILNEVGKICGAHYDEGQARWTSPWKHLSLFHAWRRMASLDRRMEIEGLTGFRSFVATLPDDPLQTLALLVDTLRIPLEDVPALLLAHAYAMPGWCAWVLQKERAAIVKPDSSASGTDLAGLLALRLSHEVSLLLRDESLLGSYREMIVGRSSNRGNVAADTSSNLRLLLQRAMEIAAEHELLDTIATGIDAASRQNLACQQRGLSTLPSVQLVFCIDVRSERIRRHLEALDHHLETYGFAGFFGLPLEFVPLEQTSGQKQVPPLLNPKFRVYEGLQEDDVQASAELIQGRVDARLLDYHLQRLKESSVGCFAFVEAVGLSFIWHLLKKTLRWKRQAPTAHPHLSRMGVCPTLRGLNQQGLTTSRQIDLVEGMLRGIGLVHSFAPIVVICGHHSQTENNPLQAGLDCGACGGHSGEVNARFAVLLLNQVSIRQGLSERGISIPEETLFVAAVHNTTTDAIVIKTEQRPSKAISESLKVLQENIDQATRCCQAERLVTLNANDHSDIQRRSRDWSEIRPEWGLAGNHAFIVAPRCWTKSVSLGGKTFLHSYDQALDPTGEILEQIMTAPMIVAHWINMQYYASTVCPEAYGSGSKTLHNVVGRFGILSGNGGDLRTGLPWQSVAQQRRAVNDLPYHRPMRLSVFLAAKRASIDAIISRHGMLAQLIENQWLHIYSIDEREYWYAAAKVGWQPAAGFSQ